MPELFSPSGHPVDSLGTVTGGSTEAGCVRREREDREEERAPSEKAEPATTSTARGDRYRSPACPLPPRTLEPSLHVRRLLDGVGSTDRMGRLSLRLNRAGSAFTGGGSRRMPLSSLSARGSMPKCIERACGAQSGLRRSLGDAGRCAWLTRYRPPRSARARRTSRP